MEWWKLGLEYAKVIFSWPIVMVALVLILRKPINELLLKRDVELEAAGARIKVGSAEENLEEALGEAVQASEEIVPEIESLGSDSDGGHEGGVAGLESRLAAERVRRQAMERVISESSRLGWEWAQSGKKEPPNIIIHWDHEENPRVLALPSSAVSNEAYRNVREMENYYRLLLANIQIAYPGLHAFEYSIDRTGVDGTIRIGDFSANLIVKYSSTGKIPTSHLREIIGRYGRGVRPILFVTNREMTREAQRVLSELSDSRYPTIYAVQWIDASQNEDLKRVVELMISDTFSPLKTESQ
ncbi:hypothetical protein [Streptosporangium sp. NPDC000509]|uniref:hypothetical protein n=1 Tax=Streptosporangium sp. NPDC000509 TaxID=3366186 RepID=UPI00368A3CAC